METTKILNTRDLVKRLDELTAKRDELQAALEAARSDVSKGEKARKNLAEWDEGNIEELLELMEKEVPEWKDGNTLIPEIDFPEYVQDLWDNLDLLPKDLPDFIRNNINWEGVAEDLKVDYSKMEYQGATYLYRT